MVFQIQGAQTVKSDIHAMVALLSEPADEEAGNYKTLY